MDISCKKSPYEDIHEVSKYIKITFEKCRYGFDRYIEINVKVYDDDKKIIGETLLEMDPSNKTSFVSKYGYDMLQIRDYITVDEKESYRKIKEASNKIILAFDESLSIINSHDVDSFIQYTNNLLSRLGIMIVESEEYMSLKNKG